MIGCEVESLVVVIIILDIRPCRYRKSHTGKDLLDPPLGAHDRMLVSREQRTGGKRDICTRSAPLCACGPIESLGMPGLGGLTKLVESLPHLLLRFLRHLAHSIEERGDGSLANEVFQAENICIGGGGNCGKIGLDLRAQDVDIVKHGSSRSRKLKMRERSRQARRFRKLSGIVLFRCHSEIHIQRHAEQSALSWSNGSKHVTSSTTIHPSFDRLRIKLRVTSCGCMAIGNPESFSLKITIPSSQATKGSFSFTGTKSREGDQLFT